jgi:uncharacterized protein involved in exopolysaccharide biosynthesis
MATDKSNLVLISEGQVDLSAVARVVWRFRWLVLVCAVGFAAGGALYASLATKWYKAEITVAQVEDQSIPAGMGQLGGLASLVGINLGSTDSSKVSLAVLRSREFAREFLAEKQLINVLLPHGDGDVRDAADYFVKDVLSVYEDRKTGVISISVVWTDPEQAAQWAVSLVEYINARLRTRALLEAERNIKYLREEIAATNITSLQQSISRVLEAQMQKLLLAKGDDEFAFQIVDRPAIPKFPHSPKLLLWSLATGLIGIITGALVALWWHCVASGRSGAQGGK